MLCVNTRSSIHNYQNSLTASQQTALTSLDLHTHALMIRHFKYMRHYHELTPLRLALDIIHIARNTSFQEEKKAFILTLLQTSGHDEDLEIKLAILKKNCHTVTGIAQAFFRSLSTRTIEGHTLHTLKEYIQHFNDHPHTYPPAVSSAAVNVSDPIANIDPESDAAKLEQQALATPIAHETAKDIQTLIRRFAGSDSLVKFTLDSDKLATLHATYLQVHQYCVEWQQCGIAELIQKAVTLRDTHHTDNYSIAQLLAIGRLALRLHFFPIYLHPTQVMTVLALHQHSTGCIAQVKTGEGKSMIVALMAFIAAMQKRDVHIISSSASLAMRDQMEFSSFFQLFGIKSSHICKSQRQSLDFDAQLLYGTAHDYEFAIMEELCDFRKLFSSPFNNCTAIVDEVDNLTIDTALNAARLGRRSEISYNWIYLPILTFVKENLAREAKAKLSTLDTLNSLKSYLRSFRQGEFTTALQTISDEQLHRWLSSAHHALYELVRDENYIVETPPVSLGMTSKSEIVIIDADNTGKRMIGSRWSQGIHEFLEIKHRIPLQDESITPISMSHSVFYAFYPMIYGLTGTIGSKEERDEIKEIYNISSFDVPTHRPSIRIDNPPVILPNNAQHIAAILAEIRSCIQQQRPILVLCSTINMTEILAQQLNSNRIRHEILNETQTRDEEDILRDAGLPRAVTIATNNAGRGTDIKLKGASKANGGLHVLITFFPETLRVEEQGRGRAGRQGEPGSSTIVLSAEALEIPTTADITTPVQQQLLLQQLDTLRKIRIYQMKTRHVCLAKLERFCFNYVREFYSKLKEFDARTKHPKFWDKCSRNLSFRILNIHKTDYRNLITQDKQIAEQACRLFQERPTEPLQWTLLLRKASLRLQEKIVYDWATQFLAYVDGLSQDSTLHSLNRFSNQLNLLNNPNNLLTQFLQQHINTAVETELNRLETAITQRYTQCTTQWEQLFDPTGKGVIDYLSKLIDVKLPNIC